MTDQEKAAMDAANDSNVVVSVADRIAFLDGFLAGSAYQSQQSALLQDQNKVLSPEVDFLTAELAALKQAVPVDERASFEAWAISDDGPYLASDMKRTEIRGYINTVVQYDWRIWQARAALPQTRELSEDEIIQLIPESGIAETCYVNMYSAHKDELIEFARAIEREIRGGE